MRKNRTVKKKRGQGFGGLAVPQAQPPSPRRDRLFHQAITLHQRQQVEPALKAYQTLLTHYPNDADALSNSGVLLKQLNRIDEAIRCYRQAAKLQPQRVEIWFNLGNTLQAQGETTEAEDAFRRAIALKPDLAAAHFNLGKLLQEQEKLDTAADCYRTAIAHQPSLVRAHTNLGNVLKTLGDFEAAIASHRQAIALTPDAAEAHFNLANALVARSEQDAVDIQDDLSDKDLAEAGQTAVRPNGKSPLNLPRLDADYAEAIATYHRALSLKPHWPDALQNLAKAHFLWGNGYQHQHMFSQAEAQFRLALQHQPEELQYLTCLALALKQQQKFAEAEQALQQVLRQKTTAAAHCNLGSLYNDWGRHDLSVKHLKASLALAPDLVVAHVNLGHTYSLMGRLSEAIAHCQTAIDLDPDIAAAHLNLGFSLNNQGRASEAIAAFRRVIELEPESHPGHSNLLYALNYQDTPSPTVVDAYAAWAQGYESLPERWQESEHWQAQSPQAVSPDRILRIGYVSPDFRRHSVAYFFEPILAHHDRTQVEIFCYSNVTNPDDVTQRLRSQADHWRDIRSLGDEAVVAQILADPIDILVDLAGHTSQNRLPVFAHKPAPIQVTYLGYPNTTGLAAMDYRLSDRWADPTEQPDPHYTETLVHLPQGFLCYQPLKDAPAVSGLPAQEKGYVTFGSCNNLAKLTPEVIALWAQVLQRVERSRMVLKMRWFDDEGVRDRYAKLFASHGIAPERVQFVGLVPDPKQHLDFYRNIDIALDPFPYNGTTTTCEALWMGVPVLTLAGQVHASRVGQSLLQTVGLADWIAQTPEDYVAKAAEFAEDVAGLVEVRGVLRSQMAASPLCDGSGQTRAIESAYRTMWQSFLSQFA